MSFEQGGFQNILDLVKKTGDVMKNINKKEGDDTIDFLKSDSTKSFVAYLTTTYTPDQIQQALGSSDINNYIAKTRKESWGNKIDKIFTIAQEVVSQETKPELNHLKEKVKNNEIVKNIPFVNDISGILSGSHNEGDNIIKIIDEFIGLSEEKNRVGFLTSHGISTTIQNNVKKTNKEEDINKETEEVIVKEKISTNIEVTPELVKRVNTVFEKYNKKGISVPIKPEKFIQVMNKYGIPLELGLAQGVIESNMGTSGGRPIKTKNIFNIGNVDNGANKNMETREEGIEVYAKLLKEKYSNDQGVVDIDYLIKNGFRNKNGNKYATDINYVKKLSATITAINEIIV